MSISIFFFLNGYMNVSQVNGFLGGNLSPAQMPVALYHKDKFAYSS